MTELDLTDGKIFLNKVTEKIRTRLAEVDASIEAGQKDIQSMNEYYWENYTEMENTAMKIMTTNKLFYTRSMTIRKN